MSSRLALVWRRRLRRHAAWQLGLLLASFWLCAELLRRTGLGLSPGVLGFFVWLALLGSGALRVASVRRGAAWLLAGMSLFFVPSTLALLDHPELRGVLALKVLLVIAASTAAVAAVVALVIEFGVRRQGPRA